MNFQEAISEDLATFLNSEEFGETHTIDDQSVVCVISSSQEGEFVGDIEGAAYVATKRIQIRDGDMDPAPVQAKKITIDGDPYRVLSISREMGMLVVTVTENSPA